MAQAAQILPPPLPATSASLEEQLRSSYLDYAMSVIVARALPDARDGMKPVHRRILFGMYEGGFNSKNKHRKSARIVGDVMGKYHPHGDASIYDAMVRMAQPFSMRLPLIDGQGNFGSPDGDPPAAMRYTEARLFRISDDAIVADLDEDSVDFRPTYDGSMEEPTVLPARFPHLLVNGGQGIAVGFATNIPPHNLGEVIDVTLAMIDNPDITVEEVTAIMPGPDFPTGAIVMGAHGTREAYTCGRGTVTMVSVYTVDTFKNGRQSIVITELPYQVNKTEMLEKLAVLVNEKVIEGISDLRDESSDTVRVVIELKRDANAELVLTKLRKHTDLIKRFSTNAVCLDAEGRPRTMGVIELLSTFITFRRTTISRRTHFRLEKNRNALNTQVGLFAARSRVDDVVKLIRGAKDSETARTFLMNMEFACEGELAVLLGEVDPDIELTPVFRLSESQAKSVLALRLSSLTGLEQDSIAAEARNLLSVIRVLLGILQNDNVLDDLMRQELMDIRAKYATPRLTRIDNSDLSDIDADDLVEDKPVVLTITRQGYVKVTDLSSFREQSRGGKGKSGMETKDDDFVTMNMVCSTRTNLIFFTTRGIAHVIKAYKLPMVAANAKGKPIVNFISMRDGEAIATVMPLPSSEEAASRRMIFVTDGGDVRRNEMSDFSRINTAGKIAMKLEDENGLQTARLISVMECTDADDLMLATRRGKAVRFPVTDVRVFSGRGSIGVKGVTLGQGDAVISACIVKHLDITVQERDAYFDEGTTTWKETVDGQEIDQTLTLTPERMKEIGDTEQTLLSVTALGFGKRVSSHEYRTTGRGGVGVIAGPYGAATGELVALRPVQEQDGIMLVTNGGQSIRTRCSEIRVMRRTARGVSLFDLPDGQSIVDVARVPADDADTVPATA
jgi:DNA gyrase subunit A